MPNYIFVVIFGLLTIWSITETIRGIRKRIDFEIYAHLGMLVFFATLLIGSLPFSNEAFIAIFQRNPLGIEEAGKWIGLGIVIIAAFPFGLAIKAFESEGGTSRLVTSGIFKYVRHPLSLAMVILAFGLVVWRLSVASIVAYLVFVVCTSIARGREEKFLLKKFGDEYREYRKKVPGFNLIKGLIKSRRKKEETH